MNTDLFFIIFIPLIIGIGLLIFLLSKFSRYRNQIVISTLQNSENYFRSAFENAPIGIALLDNQTHCLLKVNVALCTMLGYSRKELLAKTIDNILHPDDSSLFRKSFQSVDIKSGKPSERHEGRYLHKNGQVIWIQVISSTPIGNNYRILHMQDITERKQAELVLHETETRFRNAFENAPIGMIMMDLHGKFQQVNKRFCTLLGYLPEEIQERYLTEFLHPEDVETSHHVLRQILEAGTRAGTLEKRCIHKQGQIVWTVISATMQNDLVNRSHYLIAQILDITERKQAEQKVRCLTNELEQRVKQRTEELTAINQAQKLFIGSSEPAHIFNTLLQDLLKLTDSELGLIGDVLYKMDGQPYLKCHAISRVTGNDKTKQLHEQLIATNMELHNPDTLFGLVMRTGQRIISNDITDPRCHNLPLGYPPLYSFLGVPLYRNEQVFAMVGLANRKNGYDEEFADFLQPILTTISQIIAAYHNDQQRKQAEQKVHHTKNQLINAIESLTAGFVMYDAEAKLVVCNQKYQDLYPSISHNLAANQANKVCNEYFTL